MRKVFIVCFMAVLSVFLIPAAGQVGAETGGNATVYAADLFNECRALKSVKLAGLDTSNVTDFTYMFYGCESLTSLDVSSFDTKKAFYMTDMFCGCASLTALDVSKFDTSSVQEMRYMFAFCDALKELDLSNFDMGRVYRAADLFAYDTSLEKLYTPRNLSSTMDDVVELPVTMKDPAGKAYKTLPADRSDSILLVKSGSGSNGTGKPKSTAITKVTAAKKAFTVKWKKQAEQTTGYQVQYSTSSSFKPATTRTIAKPSTVSKKITELKAKKKYYVRVRTYRSDAGTKAYSSWSKTVTVKTK